MSKSPTPVSVEVWSDIACPWCYVGKRRLEAALEQFEGDVKLEWRSFELNPQAELEYSSDISYVDRLAKKYGKTPAQAQTMIDGMTQTAATEGLDFHFEKIRAGNTFDAHRLLHWAKQHGKQNALKERLMAAYLSEGVLMSDHPALAELANDVGLNQAEASEVLTSNQYGSDVRADEEHAAQLGIRGVPFFVVNGKYGASGAQPPEALAQLLEQGLEVEEEAVSCTPEGCS